MLIVFNFQNISAVFAGGAYGFKLIPITDYRILTLAIFIFLFALYKILKTQLSIALKILLVILAIILCFSLAVL